MRQMLAGLALLALAACASAPTTYAPAAASGEVGYRETKLEANRYRVAFVGKSDLNAQGVEDMAMRRAAELTLQNGATWFQVVARDTEQLSGKPKGGTSVGVGGSTGSYGSGVGVGIGIDLSPDTRTYEAVMEILIGTGDKPDMPAAYDARAVLTRTTTPAAP